MFAASSNLNVSGDIAAITALVVALTGLIGGIAAFVPIVRRQKATQATVEATHKLVNGAHTAMVAYQGQLVDALERGGVTVPAAAVEVPLAPGQVAAGDPNGGTTLQTGAPVH
jgi:hypothetical protein